MIAKSTPQKAWVAIQRIEAFLTNHDDSQDDSSNQATDGTPVENYIGIEGVSATWNSVDNDEVQSDGPKVGDERFRLVDISVRFSEGLTIVVGPTASGKTALLVRIVPFQKISR